MRMHFHSTQTLLVLHSRMQLPLLAQGINKSVVFGRTDPSSIPESGAWWRQRQAELLAISEPHELGMFSGMMTITQNDAAPELLAHGRRGPCAVPTGDEMLEHLLIHRGSKSSSRPNMTEHPEASVLSNAAHMP